MHIFHYIRMPQPISVLGIFYSIFIIFSLITYIKDGYWTGMINGIINLIKTKFLHLIGLIILILFIIIFLDKPITNFCKEIYNTDVYIFIDFISSMAEGWFVYGALSLAILLYSYFAREKAAIALKISLMSSIYAGLLNILVKLILNRQRPSIELNPWNFFHYFITIIGKRATIDSSSSHILYAYSSMASGHTITIVAAITPLILYTKRRTYKAILISFAILAAISRVYTINHWLSDVCAATILGIVVGKLCYSNNKYRLDTSSDYLVLATNKS